MPVAAFPSPCVSGRDQGDPLQVRDQPILRRFETTIRIRNVTPSEDYLGIRVLYRHR